MKIKVKSKKIISLVLLVILLLFFGITYSIYFSQGQITIPDQNVAKFIFNASPVDNVSLSLAGMNPGDRKDYLFSVTNNEDDNVSDVTSEYQIIIKTYHFMPFNIKVYKVPSPEDEPILECKENISRNEKNELICKSDVQEIDFVEKTVVDYRLEVVFPGTTNDEVYSNLVDFIDLEITSWQKID